MIQKQILYCLISNFMIFSLSGCQAWHQTWDTIEKSPLGILDKSVDKGGAALSQCPSCKYNGGLVARSDGKKECPQCGWISSW